MKFTAFRYSASDRKTLKIQMDTDAFPGSLGLLPPGQCTVILVSARVDSAAARNPQLSPQDHSSWDTLVRELAGKAIPIPAVRRDHDSALRMLLSSLQQRPDEERNAPVMWHTRLKSVGSLITLADKLVHEQTLLGAGRERVILLGADCSLDKTARAVEREPRSPSWLSKYWGVSHDFEKARTAISNFVNNGRRKTPQVLLLGERGTGKEVVAQIIAHSLCPGVAEPCVMIDCSQIPTDLFESTILGYEKGEHSHADRAKAGKLEEAKGRAAFLDEIGNLSHRHQMKLLRILESRELYRIGSLNRVSLDDVLFIFATNANLQQRVKDGTFLPDLYDRIKRFTIRLPSLELREDIEEHAQNYWALHFGGQARPKLTDDVLDQLVRCQWTGNSRDLGSVMENLYASCGNQVPTVDDVRNAMADSELPLPPRRRNPSKTSSKKAAKTPPPKTFRLAKLVKSYSKLRRRYERLGNILRTTLDQIAQERVISAFVQVHIMPKAEIAEWLLHPNHQDVCDLESETRLHPCSITIVVLTAYQLRELGLAFKRILGSSLEDFPDGTIPLDQGGTHDCALRFSLHIDDATRKALRTNLGVGIPDKLLGLRLRLKIKTILRHTREQICRRFQRDPSLPLPDSWLAELNEVGRGLRQADEALARMDEGVRVCSTARSDQIGQSSLQDEIEHAEALLELDPENPRLAARLGKLALDADQLKKAIEVFAPREGSGYGPLLRDFGVALCKDSQPGSRQFRRGQRLLEKACRTSGVEDADALCSLGGALKRAGSPEEAHSYYLKALEIDRANPYALGGVIETSLLSERPIKIDTELRAHMREVMKRSRMQADAKINLPWAHYDLGKYRVLLGSSLEGFSCIAEGIRTSTALWQIETTLRSFETLSKISTVPVGLSDARGLLALAYRRLVKAEDLKDADQRLRAALGKREKLATPLVIVKGGEEDQDAWDAEHYLALLSEVFDGYGGTVAFAELAGPLREAAGRFMDEAPEGLCGVFCYDPLPKRLRRHRNSGNRRGVSVQSPALFAVADLIQPNPGQPPSGGAPLLLTLNPNQSSRIMSAAFSSLGVTTLEARETRSAASLETAAAHSGSSEDLIRVALDATRLRQLLPKEVR